VAVGVDRHRPRIGLAARVQSDAVVCSRREASALAEHLIGDGVRVEGVVVLEGAFIAGFRDVDVASGVSRDVGRNVNAAGADPAVIGQAGSEAAELAEHEIGRRIRRRRVVDEDAIVALIGDVEVVVRIDADADDRGETVRADAAVVEHTGRHAAELSVHAVRDRVVGDGRVVLEHAIVVAIGHEHVVVRVDRNVDGVPEAVRTRAAVVKRIRRERIELAEYAVRRRTCQRRVVLQHAMVAVIDDVQPPSAVDRNAGGVVEAVGRDAAVVRDAGREAAELTVDAGGGRTGERRVVFEHAMVVAIGDPEAASLVDRHGVRTAETAGVDGCRVVAVLVVRDKAAELAVDEVGDRIAGRGLRGAVAAADEKQRYGGGEHEQESEQAFHVALPPNVETPSAAASDTPVRVVMKAPSMGGRQYGLGSILAPFPAMSIRQMRVRWAIAAVRVRVGVTAAVRGGIETIDLPRWERAVQD
jgi:hypothetical protein